MQLHLQIKNYLNPGRIYLFKVEMETPEQGTTAFIFTVANKDISNLCDHVNIQSSGIH